MHIVDDRPQRHAISFGARSMTSWLVSSEVSVSPYALTSLIDGLTVNQRRASSAFSASPVTDTHFRSGSSQGIFLQIRQDSLEV